MHVASAESDEAETEALLGASSAEFISPTPEGSAGPRHQLFAMTHREVRELLHEEQVQMQAEQQRDLPQPVPPPLEEKRLVVDPCLGRLELLWAKARLALVILSGFAFVALLGRLGHNWLEMRLAKGEIPPMEAALLIGVVMPAALVGFLCVLEHTEWRYVRTVFPTSEPYTPLLHELLPRLRRLCRL
ncbi:3'-5' exonuclease eri-1 [Durusdinium trenchii]